MVVRFEKILLRPVPSWEIATRVAALISATNTAFSNVDAPPGSYRTLFRALIIGFPLSTNQYVPDPPTPLLRSHCPPDQGDAHYLLG